MFISLVWLVVNSTISSQAPQAFNYQAVARNTGGNLIINQNISVRVSILTGSPVGATEYSETHSVTTDAYGVFNLLVGNGTPVSGVFNSIPWETGPKYLKIEADVTGGTAYQALATTQILSMPYALYANKAEILTGTITETQGLADVLAINNSATAQIKNLTNPSEAQDAATKDYVDALLSKPLVMESQQGIVRDYDGNIYTTIKIGDQIWMAENLKTTRYSDGNSLVNGTGAGNITGNYTTKYWFVYEDNSANKDTYGLLYTWAAAMNGSASSDKSPSGIQGVCPIGWHLPSDTEWKSL